VPPELHASDVTPRRVRSAVFNHGSLLVRGLLPERWVAPLVHDIDGAFAGYDDAAARASNASGDYVEFVPPPGEAVIGEPWDHLIPRSWGRARGGISAVDAPHALFDVLEALDEAGVRHLVAGALGEEPALSVKKTTLRRAGPDADTDYWHQDGAFMGTDIRSLNVWIALSHCGREAPGLEIVAGRLDGLAETGTEGARFDWSVSDDAARRAAGSAPIVTPEFSPGDALLFDHLLLHRTAVSPSMTGTRHAIEAWFFAPSAYPIDQIPIVY
jgi:hypothetical protein